MAYRFRNITPDIISLHPFGVVLKPNEELELEYEDINTQLVQFVDKGILSVNPPLPINSFPLTENQTINVIDDLMLRHFAALGLHTEIFDRTGAGATREIEIFVGCRVNTYDANGNETTAFIPIVSPFVVEATLQQIGGGGLTFNPAVPKFKVVTLTANRDKFSTSSNAFSFDSSSSLLAGILPPQTYKMSATAVVSGIAGGEQIKAVVTGLGAKVFTF